MSDSEQRGKSAKVRDHRGQDTDHEGPRRGDHRDGNGDGSDRPRHKVPAKRGEGRRDAGVPDVEISSEDITQLLEFAFESDPESRRGKRQQRTAAEAAARLIRDLQPRARALGGELGAALERQPDDRDQLEAALERWLPGFGDRVRAFMDGPDAAPSAARPGPSAEELMEEATGSGTAAAEAQPAGSEALASELTAPAAPSDVIAEPGPSSATVQWSPPAPSLDTITHYLVTPVVNGTEQPPSTIAPSLSSATVLGLVPGTAYRFTVTAVTLTGIATSDLSNEVVPFALPEGEDSPELKLPAFSSDSLLLLHPAAEPARGLLAAAGQTGATWRYEYLREQAIAAAQNAMGFEQQVSSVMAMAVEKMGVSQELLADTLRAAIQELEQAKGNLSQIANAPTVDELIGQLGDVASESLLLPRFLDWLAQNSPVQFWIGLFEAVIRDLAAVVPIFGGPTGFSRTKSHLEQVFSSDIGGVASGLREAAQTMLDRLDADVAEMVAPLHAAVTQMVAETQEAMAEVFDASDITLLMTPPQTPGGANVADLDPLQDLYAELTARVDQLAEQIKQRIRDALQPLLNGSSDLFKTLVITYLVIPILAFLIISLAGGPISAALLAAAVLLAAQELVHLLLRWLTGPLRDQVTAARQQLTDIVGQLQTFFAEQAGLITDGSSVPLLDILSRQLRQVSDFVPQQFLEDTAAVLEEARAVVLRSATQLGVAAEQALGKEHGTAFDAIALDYRTDLALAPQLPGGRDQTRLAGAALLRDLGRLEQQRTALSTGKDVVFTHRVSLARLLGGDPTELARFLEHGEIVVELDERELLDGAFPGVHRALIQQLDVTGILADTPTGTGQLTGIPLTATHLGESRTRIKPDANPYAPPLGPPECFPGTVEEFVQAVTGDPTLPDELSRILDTVDLQPFKIYFLALLFAAIGGHDDPMEAITGAFKTACREHLPAAMGRLVEQASCGAADRELIEHGTRRLIDSVRFADAIGDILLPPDAGDRPDDLPDLEAAAEALAELLREDVTITVEFEWPDEVAWDPWSSAAAAPAPGPGPGRGPGRRAGITGPAPAVGPLAGGIIRPPWMFRVVPGLESLARLSYEAALAALLTHTAKWGDATLEEDPDPQVRALGYKTLVRRMRPETVVFNLFPDDRGTALRAQPLRPEDLQRRSATPGLQQRPMENRGLGGRVLLRLEQVGDQALANSLAGTLTDLVLDFTLRGCFDADLAQTVRASRQQDRTARAVADALSGTVDLPLPSALGSVDAGASELRRVHFGLRGHRDKSLRTWAAAAQTAPQAAASLAAALQGASPLSRDGAFEPLGEMSELALTFVDEQPIDSLAWLEALVDTIPVSPADLGLHSGVLTDRDVREHARLESIGLAVIPMPGPQIGVSGSDPLDVRLHATGPLAELLPGFAQPTAFPDRLMISQTVPAPPPLASLFDPATPALLRLEFDGDAIDGGKLYDVIVSLTFRVPVAEVTTASSVLV